MAKKRENPIRALLGLKQEDIAMLLGISRAHWGMYEIGKRDLPIHAVQLLAEMLTHMNAANPESKHAEVKYEVSQEQLQRLQLENEYQRHLNQRKIAAALKNRKYKHGCCGLTIF